MSEMERELEQVPELDRTGRSDAVDPSTDGTVRPMSDVVVRAENLTKVYGSGPASVTAVDGIDLEIERGTVVGLLGPNGAGKTTTIKLLLGLIVADEGHVSINGVDVGSSPRRAYRSVAAMLEGARNVYWRLTVRENVRFFARLADQPVEPARIDELIEHVGLAEKADTAVNELSRGMKQKTSLACTLVRETPVTFLDEPTLGLDVESSLDLRQELRRLVEMEDRTVILSSHDMDVIEAVCDRVIIMNDGRIVADDDIDELLSVFRTQAYRLEVDGRFDTSARQRFNEAYGATEWIAGDGWTRFDAMRVRGQQFHDLIADIEEVGATVLSLEALEPDLEEVFLDVTEAGVDRRPWSSPDDRSESAATGGGRSNQPPADSPNRGGHR